MPPSPESQGIFEKIAGYRGTELQDWNVVERAMFNEILSICDRILKRFPPSRSTLDVRELVKRLERTVRTEAASGEEPHRLHSNKLPEQLDCYTIGSLAELLGAVSAIGRNEQAEENGYLIKFLDGTLVYLCPGSHYAYPLRIGSDELSTLKAYVHSYADFMEEARKAMRAEDVRQVVTGELHAPWTPGASEKDRILLATAFVSSYICESNRNWMQAFLSIVLLGTKTMLGDATDPRELTTFEAHQRAGAFPMGGGGWNQHCTWGGGLNPHTSAITSPDAQSPGDNTRRWFLALWIDISTKVPVQIKGKWTVLNPEDWQDWIDQLLEARRKRDSEPGVGRNPASIPILQYLEYLIGSSIKSIGNGRA